MSSQLVNLNLGYGNKAIGDAIKAQVDKYCFVCPFLGSEPRVNPAVMIFTEEPTDKIIEASLRYTVMSPVTLA